MEFIKKDKFTILVPDSVDELPEAIQANYQRESYQNLVLDLSSGENISDVISDYLETLAEEYQDEKKSLVAVVKTELLKELDGIIVAVPTLSEAADYVYMEELEREI